MRQIIWDILIYAINALPPSYRLTKFLLFVQAAFYPLDWRKRYLDKYLYSKPSDFLIWSGIVTYDFYAEVAYNYGIYVSLIPGNLNNTPDTSPDSWLLVNANWIGLNERIQYNGRYLTLTYALNRYFKTAFRQPPYPSPYGGSGTFSDIHITNLPPTYLSLIGFPTLEPEDTTYPIGGSYYGFPTLITGSATSYQFAINIPAAFYASLGAPAVAESVIRTFANRYVPAGISYSIITY